MRVLQIKFTRLAAVCFSWDLRKLQRWRHGVAITGPLALLVLPLPCHPRASMEEQQSATGRSQGHRLYKGPFPFGAAGIFSFSPKARASRRCSQKSSWLLGSPSACQHGVHSLLLYPVLCLVGWWGLPRAGSPEARQSLQPQELTPKQWLINVFVLDTL